MKALLLIFLLLMVSKQQLFAQCKEIMQKHNHSKPKSLFIQGAVSTTDNKYYLYIGNIKAIMPIFLDSGRVQIGRSNSKKFTSQGIEVVLLNNQQPIYSFADTTRNTIFYNNIRGVFFIEISVKEEQCIFLGVEIDKNLVTKHNKQQKKLQKINKLVLKYSSTIILNYDELQKKLFISGVNNIRDERKIYKVLLQLYKDN